MKVFTTEVFDYWFSRLRDQRVKLRIQARIDRVEDGNFGDWKPISGGVAEMRLHFGPGYRLYYTLRGDEIVILLAGGDKGSQRKDIETAIALAKQI